MGEFEFLVRHLDGLSNRANVSRNTCFDRRSYPQCLMDPGKIIGREMQGSRVLYRETQVLLGDIAEAVGDGNAQVTVDCGRGPAGEYYAPLRTRQYAAPCFNTMVGNWLDEGDS